MIMSTANISITIEEITLEKIDSIRGLIPRSAFIENILEKSLSKKGVKKL